MALSVLGGPVIPAGESLSDVADCGGLRVLRIVTPDDWTRAPLTFLVSPDGVLFRDLYHTQTVAGAFIPYEVVVPDVEAGVAVTLPANTGGPMNWLKVRSGTRDQPVKQAAERKFRLVLDSANVPVPGPAGPAGPTGSAGPAGGTGPAGVGVTGPTGAYNPKGVIDASNAAAGMVGEVISGSNPTGIALVTNIPTNLITLHLTPGDWNVGSITTFTPVGTGPNGLASGITLTSASLPTDAEITSGAGILNQLWASSMPSGKVQNIPTSLVRVNTAVPKDVFLVVMGSFGGGTVTATGYMSARRVR